MNPNALAPIEGTTVIIEQDTVSFHRPNDTPIERATFEVNSIPVQVIRYNGDDAHIAVAIGGPFGSVETMPAAQVADYIRSHTEDGQA